MRYVVSATRTVLHRAGDTEHHVAFGREPDDHTDIPAVLMLPIGKWEDLGQPESVTVTVEPGDLLNAENDAA